jgi:hypothetical protein
VVTKPLDEAGGPKLAKIKTIIPAKAMALGRIGQ